MTLTTATKRLLTAAARLAALALELGCLCLRLLCGVVGLAVRAVEGACGPGRPTARGALRARAARAEPPAGAAIPSGREQARAGLVGLGYRPEEVRRALGRVADGPVAEMVRGGLRELAS